MLKTGVREIEVLRANYMDYQTAQDGKNLWVQGKGRADKDEFVVIVPEVQTLLETYLFKRTEEREKKPMCKIWTKEEEPLFLTLGKRRDHRLAPAGFDNLTCCGHNGTDFPLPLMHTPIPSKFETTACARADSGPPA